MKLPLIAAAAAATFSLCCLQVAASASTFSDVDTSVTEVSAPTEPLSNNTAAPSKAVNRLERKEKPPSFRKVMTEIEKADKDYFYSGNFHCHKPQCYDFLFKGHEKAEGQDGNDVKEKVKPFVFPHKRVAKVIAYMIESKQFWLASKLASKWIQYRNWKQHNRKRMQEDLQKLVDDLRKNPALLLPTFKLLVEKNANEIVHECSWAPIVADVIKVEASIKDLSEDDREETVDFMIVHFFRVQNESQLSFGKEVVSALNKSFKDSEDVKFYLDRFEAQFADLASPDAPQLKVRIHDKSTCAGEGKEGVAESESEFEVDDGEEVRSLRAFVPLCAKRTTTKSTTGRPKTSRSPPKASKSGSSSAGQTLNGWYQNVWVWLAILAICGGIICLGAVYYSTRSKRSSLDF